MVPTSIILAIKNRTRRWYSKSRKAFHFAPAANSTLVDTNHFPILNLWCENRTSWKKKIVSYNNCETIKVPGTHWTTPSVQVAFLPQILGVVPINTKPGLQVKKHLLQRSSSSVQFLDPFIGIASFLHSINKFLSFISINTKEGAWREHLSLTQILTNNIY